MLDRFRREGFPSEKTLANLFAAGPGRKSRAKKPPIAPKDLDLDWCCSWRLSWRWCGCCCRKNLKEKKKKKHPNSIAKMEETQLLPMDPAST